MTMTSEAGRRRPTSRFFGQLFFPKSRYLKKPGRKLKRPFKKKGSLPEKYLGK